MSAGPWQKNIRARSRGGPLFSRYNTVVRLPLGPERYAELTMPKDITSAERRRLYRHLEVDLITFTKEVRT